jgi:acetyltransferase-like isoleucine patch superfamily enzyme
MSGQPRQNVDPQGSAHSGLTGFFERTLRRLKLTVHLLVMLPLAALFFSCIGVSLMPGIALFRAVAAASAGWPDLLRCFALGASLGAGYFAYGFSMLLVIPAVCAVLRARAVAFRGPYYSAETARWYISNAFLYLVRYSFLEFVTPTPFNVLFYRLMGMKIGRGSQINSTHISDPAMIELGAKVTIGGSAVIVAHYGQAGYLIIAPVRIGDGATIGLRATIMAGVEIGAGAKILPNSVVLPKTCVPPGEVWGGVPARKISLEELSSLRKAA